MKHTFRWCGIVLAFGLSSAGAATLNLQLDPDRRLVPVGKDQEVVVKIDLESETGRRPNRLPLNLAVVIDHSGSMAGAKIATVGVSAFAVESLTDLVFMQLPKLGRRVKAGEPFGEIESVKAVSDLYSPVSGKIVEVNSSLPNHPETLGTDPYGTGWIAKIKIDDESSLAGLLDYAAYQKQCAEEH